MRARSKKKKPPRRRFLISILFLCLLGAAIYYILSLPIWKIQEVSVSGTTILSAREIKEISGIPYNENLFLSSLARTRNNLKKIPAIKDFHIYRIPPATILIRISERVPIAVVILKGNSAIIDKEGYILNRNPNLSLNISKLEDLPVISGISGCVNDRIDASLSQLLSDIMIELSALLGSRRIQIDVGNFKDISFSLNDLSRVRIGRNEKIKEKMAVFKKLLPVIADRWGQVEYVDVRFPKNPVIKFK